MAGSGPPTESFPSASLFAAVVGQRRAVSQLMASARRPVHAYLLHGPPGSGKRSAARGFAAALLCPDGGCGVCSSCRRALAGIHPDQAVVERTGPSLSVSDAQGLVALSQRRPIEAARQVLVATEVDLARDSVPVLLKSVEEPPPTTVFVLSADDLPARLDTIVSRCVTVGFDPVPERTIAEWLAGQGVEPEHADAVARASRGRLDRARLLVDDAGFAARQQQWRTVPEQLDGTGAAAAVVGSQLLESVDAALEPLRDEHARHLSALEEQAEMTGSKTIPGRRQIEDGHRREERRWRTDDLRFGLATLAEVYRDRLVSAASTPTAQTAGGAADSRRAARQVGAIEDASLALERNANETLIMDALLVRLSGMLD